LVLSSAAARKPAPFINARYPPPETAIPIFGRVEALPETLLMYASASNPEMFIRLSHSVIGAMVAFLRSCSHDVSSEDKFEASRMVGLVDGQDTEAGAYPPEGELGNARFAAARTTAAYSPAVPSRGITIEEAVLRLADGSCEQGASNVYHH
jgi:hypothetical protein